VKKTALREFSRPVHFCCSEFGGITTQSLAFAGNSANCLGDSFMPSLLVVDDSEIERRLVLGLLQSNTDWNVETAADGVEALERLGESPFDVVITDMQMPEMDGLELVKQMGVRCPDVPVILMTAHGSDSLAIEALEQGAASYVPKARLADSLEDSIARVLALAETDRNYERLLACQTRAEFSFELDNDPALIDPLVDLIRKISCSMGLCNANGGWHIGIALQEAIANGMYHGNLELSNEQIEEARESLLAQPASDVIERRRRQSPYQDRTISIDARMTPEKLEVRVKDEGPGFDVSAAEALLNGAPRVLEGGRGLRLMRIMMDEVRYNESGNEVLLVKHREPASDD